MNKESKTVKFGNKKVDEELGETLLNGKINDSKPNDVDKDTMTPNNRGLGNRSTSINEPNSKTSSMTSGGN